jgi:hypothetical protein
MLTRRSLERVYLEAYILKLRSSNDGVIAAEEPFRIPHLLQSPELFQSFSSAVYDLRIVITVCEIAISVPQYQSNIIMVATTLTQLSFLHSRYLATLLQISQQPDEEMDQSILSFLKRSSGNADEGTLCFQLVPLAL